MAYIFTHLTDNSFFCGHQFQPHSDIDPSCHNHSYRSLNCTGFSGEQLAKQVSPQLKKRDPCASNTRNAPSKNRTLENNPPNFYRPILECGRIGLRTATSAKPVQRANPRIKKPRQAVCVDAYRYKLQFACAAKLWESMLFWLEKLYPGHMPKAGMHRGVRKGR